MWLWPIGSIVLGDLGRGCPVKDFARPVVDLGDELVEFYLGEVLEAGAFWKVFANPAVEVLVRAALLGGVRVGEIGRDSEGVGELVVERELGSVVDRHGRDHVGGSAWYNPICASRVVCAVGPGSWLHAGTGSVAPRSCAVRRCRARLGHCPIPSARTGSGPRPRQAVRDRGAPCDRSEWTFLPERLRRFLCPRGRYCHSWRSRRCGG